MADLCYRCGGKGTYLGNGMIITDCDLCANLPSEKKSAPALDKLDRNSLGYKEAIKQLMDSQKIGKKEATALFDKTYEKV